MHFSELYDTELIERLIIERCGSKNRFEVESSIPKSTLGRWLSGTSRPSGQTFLKFCAALDVDPLGLVRLSPEVLPSYYRKALLGIASGYWPKELSGLEYLRDMVPMSLFSARACSIAGFAGFGTESSRPSPWPPDSIAAHFRGADSAPRKWYRWSMEKAPGKDRIGYYGSYLIRPSCDPQAFYFASRLLENAFRDWWWYGYVVRQGERCLMLNLTSECETGKMESGHGCMAVSTYIEREPAQFQIVSLHAFDTEFVEDLDSRWDGSGVCFRHPHVR